MNAATCDRPEVSELRCSTMRFEQADWVSPDQPSCAWTQTPGDTIHIGAPDAVTRIEQEFHFRVAAVRQQSKLAMQRGVFADVIERILDLVSLDECMVHAMARATNLPRDEFDRQRLLRRSDIEMLLQSAERIGDQGAEMLAKALVKNQQRYLAAALEAAGQASLPGM